MYSGLFSQYQGRLVVEHRRTVHASGGAAPGPQAERVGHRGKIGSTKEIIGRTVRFVSIAEQRPSSLIALSFPTPRSSLLFLSLRFLSHSPQTQNSPSVNNKMKFTTSFACFSFLMMMLASVIFAAVLEKRITPYQNCLAHCLRAIPHQKNCSERCCKDNPDSCPSPTNT